MTSDNNLLWPFPNPAKVSRGSCGYGTVTEPGRAVTCPRVWQVLEVSLGPWGSVGAQVQGQEHGCHLRAPGTLREQLKRGLFVRGSRAKELEEQMQ